MSFIKSFNNYVNRRYDWVLLDKMNKKSITYEKLSKNKYIRKELVGEIRENPNHKNAKMALEIIKEHFPEDLL